MKKILVSFVVLFIVVFTYTTIAQEFGSLRKNSVISFPEKIQNPLGSPLAAGTYSIGTGGYFPTIDSAFKKLSDDGIAGEIVLELIDELYIAPTTQYGFLLNGPIPGAASSSRVTIKPSANKNVVIQGNGQISVTINNTNYVTIDGVSLTGTTTLTIHTLKNNTYTFNDGIDFTNNSDHNVMQNIIFINEDVTRAGGSGFWTGAGYSTAPDSNVIQNNFVKQAGMAFYLSTYNSPVRATGNIIRGNKIGSEADSLIAWGIQLTKCQHTIVENNIIQNIKVTCDVDQVNPGINSFCGTGDIIKNNIVHNIKASKGYSSVGILLSGGAGFIGSNNEVYNNMIYDISSSSSSYDSRVTGIQMWSQNNPKVYYNSVYLTGTGSNKYGSAALYVYLGTANADIRNNVFVNTRDESPYCASTIRAYSTYSTFTSDYNDLYYESSPYSCLITAGNSDYHTLAEWQVTGKDVNSVNEMPNFISPDLHIFAGPSYLESHATPIIKITEDFDGNPRHPTTPDIGADEFNGTIVNVENENSLPTVFALEQNYPNPFNPSTTFRYSIPNELKVVIKVYDVLGKEIETLVNEEKPTGSYEVKWNANQLVSGLYFYQLQAGDFLQTKKMILLK